MAETTLTTTGKQPHLATLVRRARLAIAAMRRRGSEMTTEGITESVEMNWPVTDACQCFGSEWTCMCGPLERVLRIYAYQATHALPAMTPKQKEWCVNEIVYCSEGTTRRDVEGGDDQQLARAVLSAWLDFARDKGLC